MSWRERLAYELVKPRRSDVLNALLMAVGAAVALWGVAVCVTITLAVLAAIFSM